MITVPFRLGFFVFAGWRSARERSREGRGLSRADQIENRMWALAHEGCSNSLATSLVPSKSKIRHRHRAACALTLMCVLVPAARARQQTSTGDSTATKKPATNTATTPHKTTTGKTTTTTSSTTKSSATTSKTHTASSGKRSSRKKSVMVRGQKKIDAERAQKIQQALIREHYLTGEPTGTWNQSSEDAMRRYQADHGWQTKEVPDSRALIKLGLGPSNDHLLNPESAMTSGTTSGMTSGLAARQAPSSVPASHSAAPESHTTNNPTAPADPKPAGLKPADPSPADPRPATTPGPDPQHPQ
jgi:hypothetical protein